MRSHKQIIVDAGGYQAAASRVDASDNLLPGRMRFWMRRNSIPADRWSVIVAAGLTTLEELATAAAAKAEAA